MKKFILLLFSENSEVSMMRLMSFTALCIGGYLAVKGENTSVAIFVGAAFTGKAAQKMIEIKNSNKNEDL